jgi:hypothetical protein
LYGLTVLIAQHGAEAFSKLEALVLHHLEVGYFGGIRRRMAGSR